MIRWRQLQANLDSQGRPKQFFGNRIHDTCYRRPFFDARMFVEKFDDAGGWCLYKVGYRGPETYNSCGNMRWYNGMSYPVQSGHGCIGCSENNFWDNDARTLVRCRTNYFYLPDLLVIGHIYVQKGYVDGGVLASWGYQGKAIFCFRLSILTIAS